MPITIQCILFLLAGVLWRNAVGKGPLEALLAAATGWLRILVLTGRRTRSRPDMIRPQQENEGNMPIIRHSHLFTGNPGAC